MAKEDLLHGNPETQFKAGQEQVRIARKGGIASGVARRKKGASRRYLKQLLALTPNLTKAEETAIGKLGIPEEVEIDNEFLITMAMLKKARDGDLRAIDMVHEYLGEDPHTMLEEKRIKAQESAIRSLKDSDGFMSAMGNVVEEVFEDGGDTPDSLEEDADD